MFRREFLQMAGAVLPAPEDTRKRIAAVVTVYRPKSHADLRLGRLLEGYYHDGQVRRPHIRVISLYTDQVPSDDMSRMMAAQHNVRIFPDVEQTLTLKSGKLAVDGVLLIGEHGNYSVNERGQTLYPRYDLYKQIIKVFRQSKRAVPVYCDKHLSYDWENAKWMFEQSRELRFPLMAGSSVPFTWRIPPLEIRPESPVVHAVLAASGPKESYGFHALEGLQCMVDRRKGGETGIAAVRCLEGSAVWEWTSRHGWASRLLDRALSSTENRSPGRPEENVKAPILFLLEYRSGLQAAVYMLNGHLRARVFAASIDGVAEPLCTEFWNQDGRPWGHSLGEMWHIEQMILTGRAAYPAERALLTTGALAALMESSYHGGKRVETPHLDLEYRAPKQSLFSTGPRPALQEPAG